MEPHEHPPLPPAVPPVTRRDFLFKLGLGLNVIAAVMGLSPAPCQPGMPRSSRPTMTVVRRA